MKSLNLILSFCFIALTVIPCTNEAILLGDIDHCSSTIQNNKNTNRDNPINHCSSCNPLSSCHCCSVVFSFSQLFSIAYIIATPIKHENYSESIPHSIIISIWQPPKVS